MFFYAKKCQLSSTERALPVFILCMSIFFSYSFKKKKKVLLKESKMCKIFARNRLIFLQKLRHQ